MNIVDTLKTAFKDKYLVIIHIHGKRALHMPEPFLEWFFKEALVCYSVGSYTVFNNGTIDIERTLKEMDSYGGYIYEVECGADEFFDVDNYIIALPDSFPKPQLCYDIDDLVAAFNEWEKISSLKILG